MRIFYLKAEAKVELEGRDIRLADVADILCEDDRAQRAAQELIVYRFSGAQRAVVDVLKLIGLLHESFPGCQVVSLGADAVLVECRRIKPHPVWENIKIALIALLSFFGAAFTIMAFHNDISIDDIFSKVYLLVTGMESDGFTVLEISYSVGLSAGILLFFNHIGTRRITKDPTPIEVQMRQYESDVVTALVENADRERAHADCGERREKEGADREHAGHERRDTNREQAHVSHGRLRARREKEGAGREQGNADREEQNASREQTDRENGSRGNADREEQNASREQADRENGSRGNADRGSGGGTDKKAGRKP